jgi:hypothetical protein
MTISNTDKEILKSALAELIQEKPALFKEVIQEILEENKIIISDEQLARRQRLEAIIEEDFSQHDEVFRALA